MKEELNKNKEKLEIASKNLMNWITAIIVAIVYLIVTIIFNA